MSGERQGRREANERFVESLRKSGVDSATAERLARQAAVRADRAQDGTGNPANEYKTGSKERPA